MADAGHKKTDELLTDLEKKIKKEYNTARKEVQAKMDRYIGDVAVQAAAQRDLLKAGKITQQDYNDWMVRKMAMGKRWEELRDNLADDMNNHRKIAQSITKGFQADAYAINHNFAIYQCEHDGKCSTVYQLYDRRTVERLMKENQQLMPPPGKRVKQAIKNGQAKRWNKAKLQSALTQSILQGESIPDIADRVARTVSVMSYNDSIRYARTMITGAENAGRNDGYGWAQDHGIELEKEWIATLDDRTRHSHRLLHGERVPVDDAFSNGCRFPGDPAGDPAEVYNCRCTIKAQIKGFETETVTSSPKMGELSFEEWQGEKRAQAEPRPHERANESAVSRFLAGSITQKELGQAALKEYGVDNIPVYDDAGGGNYGYCLIGSDGYGRARVDSYHLKGDDARPPEYKVKTAYHEGYHAAGNGRPSDMYLISDKRWTNIEETFAESSSHYLAEREGIKGLAPSYADKLVRNLPKLQTLDDFKDCVTIADFGKVAYDKRQAGQGSEWEELANFVSRKRVNYARYMSRYTDDIKGYDGIVDKILENMPSCKAYKRSMEYDLEEALYKVNRGISDLTTNEGILLDNAVAIIMGSKGVKPL